MLIVKLLTVSGGTVPQGLLPLATYTCMHARTHAHTHTHFWSLTSEWVSEWASEWVTSLKWKLHRNSFGAVWIALKTYLGLFMPDQYYQVAVNDSWKWTWVDFFLDHAHHPWTSLLYSTIVSTFHCLSVWWTISLPCVELWRKNNSWSLTSLALKVFVHDCAKVEWLKQVYTSLPVK